ncbi:hypothetical protein HCN44_010277 [Aphidius gifuensis]|uniref:Peptidase S1 domain-containing protein n=1 Tax=Aphidius gifuensis TaxID=684658 RepID=A0A834XXX2_APHGI|nr:hypothetical protein HCN44_010277 [Aphidius gifuensis]
MVGIIKPLLYLTIINITICYAKKPKTIVGGTASKIEKHPHQVSIHWIDHFLCSGSIISQNHILSAASCILFELGHIASNLKIIAGTNDKWNMLLLGQVKYVKYVIYHEEYNPHQQWKNDLAILRLESPIVETRYSLKIKFWIRQIPLNIILSCTGWGDSYNNEGTETSRFLQSIQLNIEKQTTCERLIGGVLSLNQMCAEILHYHSAITLGDGGNPIVAKKNYNEILLVGVVSVYSGDGSGRILIFTRLRLYDVWINNIIKKY